jgi:hypothetical protein
MKKLYTLILSIALFTGTTKAQVSLTKSFNEPVIGNVVNTQEYDSTSIAPIPKNAGASQTWDFSAFSSNTVMASSTYTTPSSTPNYTDFPTSTVAEDDGNGGINYFQSTTSTFELNGIANVGNGLVISFTNSAIAAQWPISYTYNNTDLYAGTVSLGTYSGAVNGTITTTAPGNGVVMLPGNQTFSNCLQVKAINKLKGTVNGTPIGTVTLSMVGTDYNYYSSTQKFPIITVSYQDQTVTSVLGPTVTTTATTKINTAVYSGVNELTFDNSYSVYPNPTTGIFTVELSNPKSEMISVEIYDQLGQAVKKEQLGNTSVKTTINIQGMNSGVYFVRTTVGSRSSIKKLIVQ